MINYWWVTRPKRKLNSIPEVLATFAEVSLDQQWQGQRNSHLSLEEALEQAGLKRLGERRDQTGGGARTYKAWVASLGLIFTHEATGQIKLTLAGEAIMNGDSPVNVLTHQILKYQFPSDFSLRRNVNVSRRFKIRPFLFLLRLLSDARVGYLTEEEIAKIIVVEAENESDGCYNHIVSRIDDFREKGDTCLATDFVVKYAPSKGPGRVNEPYAHLLDLANTIVNWLEYTQLVKREDGVVRILDDRREDVATHINNPKPFIDRPEDQEYFQRKYGVDPKHTKDTRNMLKTPTITAKMIAEQKIKNTFISESLKTPITKITDKLIEKIAHLTGITSELVEEILLLHYSKGAIGSFMTEYFHMAFQGRDNAVAFEKATAQLFQEAFGFQAKHVGALGRTPDVLLISESDGYQAVIDNKAYAHYGVTNDHHNRMVHNYLAKRANYTSSTTPVAFFSYISGGFSKNIDMQIRKIASEANVPGSAISVTNMIELVEKNQITPFSHLQIKNIFSLNRQINRADLVC